MQASSFVNGLTEEERGPVYPPVYVPPHWERCKLCGKRVWEVVLFKDGEKASWSLCDCAQATIKELIFKIQKLETVVRDLELENRKNESIQDLSRRLAYQDQRIKEF